jgi:endonuclease/exonuclease/phosphatase family metal-dependent hydrolase
VLVNIHTKPDDATAEIGLLPDVIADVPSHSNESDIICLGDYNADGSYFDESTYTTIFPSSQYNWLIDNTEDTTVAVSDNTYDRMVTTTSTAEDYAGTADVYLFDQIYDFSSPTLEPDDVSDHYPIWAEFYTNRDTE